MALLHYGTAGAGEPLLILHGLFGSGKNWQSHCRELARHFQVFTVDLRNHGQSFHADEMNYAAMAADVEQLMSALDLESCRMLGHSMGGKVAMTLAAQHPRRITRLIVADIAPVAYFHHYNDLIEPILALPLDSIESRSEADHKLRANIPEDQLRAFLLQNMVRSAEGWHWRVNWKVIQRDMEWLTGFDLPRDWRIDVPTLFLRGSKSDYVGAAEIDVIERHFGDARVKTIEDAGHWLHAEQPAAFIRIASEFLRAS